MEYITTQQDISKEISTMIKDYPYHIDNFDMSCNSMYIAATDNNIITGCICVDNNTIKHLRVKKEFKRNNIGTTLLNNAEKVIKMREYSFSIAYVHQNNTIGLDFFYKNKYFPVCYMDYYHVLKKKLI